MGSPRGTDPRLTVMIPTIGMADELSAMLAVLLDDNVSVQVWDNGMAPDRRRALIPNGPEVVEAHGLNLYEMWSKAVTGAPTPYVAVLNDDLVLLPGTVAALADVLDEHSDVALVSPDYRRRNHEGVGETVVTPCSGTFCDGGICGWCFLVRADAWQGIHPSFEWWCGDDDMVARIEAAGHGVARLDGWPVDHVGEASASRSAWTHPARQRDLDRYAALWPADARWLASRGR